MKKQSSWIEDKYDKLIEKATSPERIDFILSQQLRIDGVRPGSVTYDLIKRKADERKNKLKGGAIMNKQMIRKLVSLANRLDKKGLYKEANEIDAIFNPNKMLRRMGPREGFPSTLKIPEDPQELQEMIEAVEAFLGDLVAAAAEREN